MRPPVPSARGMLSWSSSLRVERSPPPRCGAESPACSGPAGSVLQMRAVPVCSGRSHAFGPGGRGRAPVPRRGKAGTWGPQSPQQDKGTEPRPKTQPVASLGLALLPVSAPHVVQNSSFALLKQPLPPCAGITSSGCPGAAPAAAQRLFEKVWLLPSLEQSCLFSGAGGPGCLPPAAGLQHPPPRQPSPRAEAPAPETQKPQLLPSRPHLELPNGKTWASLGSATANPDPRSTRKLDPAGASAV